MSFGHWRRRFHVILVLQRLTKGSSAQEAAFDLGCENVNGFVTMFRKTVGKSPARYLHGRRSTKPTNDASLRPPTALPETV
ncbi:helix-turn-helix domain-containing protein [Burkholderia cenocepacia]|uniref:helix-turn-helix domain-containing protein n=1 Tax=Burkholderia cenocepacia TaxID=95486 RepID=UPI00390CCC3B